MDKFDEMIKKNAANENWELPEGLENRMEETFKNLDKVKKHKRVSLKILVSVATIMTLTFTTVMATNSDIIKQAINSVKGYFESNTESKYITDEAELEKFNSEVGITVEDKGIKLTLDSISRDDSYINAFYTIESENPIPRGEDLQKKCLDSYFQIPFLNVTADNNELLEVDREGKFENENKLKAIIKMSIDCVELGEKANFKVKTDEIFGVNGNWEIETTLDKSKIEPDAKVINVNKSLKLDNGNGTYGIDIKKVSISPLGNRIVFSYLGDMEKTGLLQFALFDDKGNSLDIISSGVSIGANINNGFEFLKVNKDTKFIKIVPIQQECKYESEPEKLIADISNLPVELKVNSKGSIIIEDVTFSDNEIRTKYRKKGLVYNNCEVFIDYRAEDGRDVSLDNVIETQSGIKRVGKVEEAVDRKDNSYTRIDTFYKEKCDFSSYKKIYIRPENEYKLLEDKAIQIDLQ